jgi:hypothetical protein
VRHSYPSGAAPRPRWLPWAWVVALVACLNPRPEELPNEVPDNDALSGNGGAANGGEYTPTPEGPVIAPMPSPDGSGTVPPADADPDPAPGAAGSANEGAPDAGAADEPADGGGG